MLKWLAGLMDRAFAVVGAVIFAQLPLFMQQYTEQLIGRESELHMQVDAMRNAAAISGKNIDQYIKKFLDSSDHDFIRQGDIMQDIVNRWHSLSSALSAMEDSSAWSRPISFIYHLNTDIFTSTFKHFTFGIPISLEGGLFALIGIVVGYLTFALLRKLCNLIVHCFSKKQKIHAAK